VWFNIYNKLINFTGSNHGSDLYMRFADEPLYQFYAADISEVCFIIKLLVN